MADWIYFSPHLDDAVFSCGGLIFQQSQAGEAVQIWTICAGDPPDALLSPFAHELHARWEIEGHTVARRREEDRLACRIVGAGARHFPIPDCIYRRPGLVYAWEGTPQPVEPPEAGRVEPPVFLYPDREALFSELHPAETRLVAAMAAQLQGLLPDRARLVSPLAVGGHVDHRLTRFIVESLSPEPWYYADYPYAAAHFDEIRKHVPAGWQPSAAPLSANEFSVWAEALAAYASQLSSFWKDTDEAKSALHTYSRLFGDSQYPSGSRQSGESPDFGVVCLWAPPSVSTTLKPV